MLMYVLMLFVWFVGGEIFLKDGIKVEGVFNKKFSVEVMIFI